MAFSAKEFLDKMKSENGRDVDEYIREKTKGNVTGTAIGAAVGFFIGYRKGYSLIVSTFIGALAGNILTKAFITKKKDNNE